MGQAGSTTDPAKRKELYAQIDRLIVDECFVLSVISLPRIWALAPYVRDPFELQDRLQNSA